MPLIKNPMMILIVCLSLNAWAKKEEKEDGAKKKNKQHQKKEEKEKKKDKEKDNGKKEEKDKEKKKDKKKDKNKDVKTAKEIVDGDKKSEGKKKDKIKDKGDDGEEKNPHAKKLEGLARHKGENFGKSKKVTHFESYSIEGVVQEWQCPREVRVNRECPNVETKPLKDALVCVVPKLIEDGIDPVAPTNADEVAVAAGTVIAEFPDECDRTDSEGKYKIEMKGVNSGHLFSITASLEGYKFRSKDRKYHRDGTNVVHFRLKKETTLNSLSGRVMPRVETIVCVQAPCENTLPAPTPLKDAIVCIQEISVLETGEEVVSDAVLCADTDEAGSFEFINLDSKNYLLRVSKEGFDKFEEKVLIDGRVEKEIELIAD